MDRSTQNTSNPPPPLVSVIVPTRNSESTIRRCLKSIQKQTYKNIELIIVDNYSKDGTRGIAKKYDAKVYLKGPERSTQVNFGVKKATGKYVYRVDSDFVLHPNIIREAVEASERCGYDAIVIHNTSDPTVSFWSRVRKVERDCYRGGELNIAARFWKKKVYEAVGGFEENLVAGDDYNLHNKLLTKNFKIGRIEPEEIHIGEPKTLTEVVQKHLYYGKTIQPYLNRNPIRAFKQFNPLRISYLKKTTQFFDDPLILIGFIVYQSVRYISTAIGLLTTRLEPPDRCPMKNRAN